MTGIALHHLVGGFKASVCNLSNTELLVVGLLSRDDRSIGHQRKMDPRIGDQVGLELGQVNIECTIKAKRGGDGGDNLTDQTVEVGVSWTVDIQVSAANVVNGLIIDHESTVRVLKGCMGGQDGVVGLNNSSGNWGSGVDSELELRFLSVVNGKTLHEKRRKSGSGATAERVEDKESLKTGALVGKLPDSIQIDNLLTDCVVSPSVVVSSIFLSGD